MSSQCHNGHLEPHLKVRALPSLRPEPPSSQQTCGWEVDVVRFFHLFLPVLLLSPSPDCSWLFLGWIRSWKMKRTWHTHNLVMVPAGYASPSVVFLLPYFMLSWVPCKICMPGTLSTFPMAWESPFSWLVTQNSWTSHCPPHLATSFLEEVLLGRIQSSRVLMHFCSAIGVGTVSFQCSHTIHLLPNLQETHWAFEWFSWNSPSYLS